MLRREEMLCFSLGVAMRRVSRIYAEALAEHDVTPPQLFLLSCLQENDGQKASDLADKVCLDASSMTGLIDRLERAGVLERRPDRDDRRALRIHLTAAGRRRLKKLERAVADVQEKIDREFFADFSDEQKAMFHRMLAAAREATT